MSFELFELQRRDLYIPERPPNFRAGHIISITSGRKSFCRWGVLPFTPGSEGFGMSSLTMCTAQTVGWIPKQLDTVNLDYSLIVVAQNSRLKIYVPLTIFVCGLKVDKRLESAQPRSA